MSCPDLRNDFPYLHERPMGHTFGEMELSDWADKADDDPVFGLYKRCGFWNREEAALLYQVASERRGQWLDIGAHTSWTTMHIAWAQEETETSRVIAVEPMLWNREFFDRFTLNVGGCPVVMPWAGRSSQFFDQLAGCPEPTFDGIVIDGDHDHPCPLLDVQDSHNRLKPGGVILLHDLIGGPVQRAANWLIEQGYRCKPYITVHCVGVCWRGDWEPPKLETNPVLVAHDLPARMTELNWARCEK